MPRTRAVLVAFASSLCWSAAALAQNTITIVSGDNQSQPRLTLANGTPTASFAPLKVLVKNGSGQPLANAGVNFTVGPHPAKMTCLIDPNTVTNSRVTTDATGTATLVKLPGTLGAAIFGEPAPANPAAWQRTHDAALSECIAQYEALGGEVAAAGGRAEERLGLVGEGDEPEAVALALGDGAEEEGGPAVTGGAEIGRVEGGVGEGAVDVESRQAGPGGDQLHCKALPEPVQAERHEVVHHVVARRHRVEHLAHAPRLVGERHLAEAEIGGFVFHGGTGDGCCNAPTRDRRRVYSTAVPVLIRG